MNWTNRWMITQPINTWYGVSVDGRGCVTALDLSNNRLSGRLSPEIGQLDGLRLLRLNNNELGGSIPTELGNLQQLTQLELGANAFTGSLPPQIGSLTRLTNLGIHDIPLSGTLPPEIGNLVLLRELAIFNTGIGGALPPEIGNLINLTNLNLFNNKFSGTLPSTLTRLQNLQQLFVPVNQFSGPIPDFLGRMTQLTVLVLNGNQFSGPIPVSLFNLVNLNTLGLAYNQLSGSIPAEIGSLRRLEYLFLHYNQLSGSIPIALTQLGGLNQLNLSNNRLSGLLPDNFGNLRNLQFLDLSENQLSGNIPAGFSRLDQLVQLNVFNNRLEGPIPIPGSSLNSIQIQGNRYTFSSILPLVDRVQNAVYAPQDSVFRDTVLRVVVGQPLRVDLEVDEGLSTNLYRWFKDGRLLRSTTGDNDLAFNPLQESDLGVYRAEIVNPVAPALTLFTRRITLEPRCIPQSVALPVLPTLCQDDPAIALDPRPGGQAGVWSGPGVKGNQFNPAGLSGVLSLVFTPNDSICLRPATATLLVNPLPEVRLPNDTLLCSGASLLLRPGLSATAFRWQDGSTGDEFLVKQAGLYHVMASQNGCTAADSIQVRYSPLERISLGPDTTLCPGAGLSLQPRLSLPPGARLRWPDGSSGSTFFVQQAGIYSLEAHLDGCRLADTIQVRILEPGLLRLGADTSLCDDAVLLLSPDLPPDALLQWSDGSKGPGLLIRAPGTYRLRVIVNSCIFEDSIRVTYLPPLAIRLPSDTLACAEAPLRLRAETAPDITLSWNTGDQGPEISITRPGLYEVNAVRGACRASAQVQVYLERCRGLDIYLPNAFSPNGDGVNDFFQLFLPPDLTILSLELQVFDRWGNQVFLSRDINTAWDGAWKGRMQQPGQYLYWLRISYQDAEEVVQRQETGAVFLMR